jgi:hypothetical protein
MHAAGLDFVGLRSRDGPVGCANMRDPFASETGVEKGAYR